MKRMTQEQLAKDITKGKIKINELVIDKRSGVAGANIMDAELDFIACTFTNSETITIHTANLSYIELNIDNLFTMIDLIEQSQEHYNKN